MHRSPAWLRSIPEIEKDLPEQSQTENSLICACQVMWSSQQRFECTGCRSHVAFSGVEPVACNGSFDIPFPMTQKYPWDVKLLTDTVTQRNKAVQCNKEILR